MKITKSMIIRESVESRELELYANNTRDVYFSSILPVVNNLKKKVRKGTFDKEKAIIAFYHVATTASNQYYKDFGYKFTVTERWTAANKLLEYWLEDIIEG